MFPLFSKIFRAKSEFYNSVGVLSRFLGPWSYIAALIQNYFWGDLNSIIPGGVINQRLGLGIPKEFFGDSLSVLYQTCFGMLVL